MSDSRDKKMRQTEKKVFCAFKSGKLTKANINNCLGIILI
jgi:hypothetical protein